MRNVVSIDVIIIILLRHHQVCDMSLTITALYTSHSTASNGLMTDLMVWQRNTRIGRTSERQIGVSVFRLQSHRHSSNEYWHLD